MPATIAIHYDAAAHADLRSKKLTVRRADGRTVTWPAGQPLKPGCVVVAIDGAAIDDETDTIVAMPATLKDAHTGRNYDVALSATQDTPAAPIAP